MSGAHQQTILAVDDSASMRQMVRFTLEGAGYKVVQASDGMEALEVARGASVDLVLTDVNMPRMDGISLVRELRSLDSYKFVPMLVLQVERTLGYALLLPTGPVGALLCISHAIGRWMPYVIYRYGGDRREFPAHVATLVVFLMCFPLLVISDRRPVTEMLTPELGVVLLYLGLRAAKDMARQRSSGLSLRAKLS